MFIIPTEKRINWQRPPIAMFGLMIINVLVFWLYQGLDNHRIEMAISAYENHKLINEELPAYQQYLSKNDMPAVNESQEHLSFSILSDANFTAYLNENSDQVVLTFDHERWLEKRNNVNQLWGKVSFEAFGLKINQINPLSLISYQFLHGDIMHLLGNMFFLLFIGFAVEAAIGSLRFTIYYLLSGIGSGLFFTLTESLFATGNLASLVGASGSISGVLAMYLALFRLKKIEFFYWILIFTGYFRSIALIILPVYILKEVYFYIMHEGSNVAYTAHIGGFICGAALILLTQSLNKKIIDTEYLDKDQDEKPKDEYLIALDQLYKQMGQCKFKDAWKSLTAIKKQFPNNAELLEIQLNLITALDQDKIKRFLIQNLGKSQNSLRIITAQLHFWKKMEHEQKQELSFYQKHQFAIDLLLIDQIEVSEKIYLELKGVAGEHSNEIAILARNIAMYYQSKNKLERAENYNLQAQELMKLTYS